MHSIVSPDSIALPAANYALGVRTVAAEVLLHTAVYAGVPAANRAFAIAARVLAEAGQAG